MPEIDTREPQPLDIHTWFSLTYANYLVVPRSVLQSMPEDWQHRFTGLLGEMSTAFGHLDWPAYDVRALKRDTELITPWIECDGGCNGTGIRNGETCGVCDGEGGWDDPEGPRYETPEEVGFRDDPIPHYNRGRTRLEPRAADGAS
jgi:hypothetical protein